MLVGSARELGLRRDVSSNAFQRHAELPERLHPITAYLRPLLGLFYARYPHL